jgi:23S rRNA (cytidine1920-2'-O)/16S rRNA (cytidine1409-2'-O)-methyltransferase
MARQRARLIELLAGRFPGRTEKQLYAAVLRGEVTVDGEKALKPGALVSTDAQLALRCSRPYVSRGGEKLARALDAWGIDCRGLVFLDAGCSTGGFTDCLLTRGAAAVIAVDVGPNTLAWSLRTDPRVIVREGTNVMSLHPDDLSPRPDAAVADLSFRSLRGAASRILGLTALGWGIFLLKPQFEWREPPAGFRGVVEEAPQARQIALGLLGDLAVEGVRAWGAVQSPIRGRRGNRELLVLLAADGAEPPARPGLDLETLFSE